VEKFVYVFNENARDTLLNRGYMLLKSDERNKRYIFAVDEKQNFDVSSVSYILSDTLTF
jgi:hypothetical protein